MIKYATISEVKRLCQVYMLDHELDILDLMPQTIDDHETLCPISSHAVVDDASTVRCKFIVGTAPAPILSVSIRLDIPLELFNRLPVMQDEVEQLLGGV